MANKTKQQIIDDLKHTIEILENNIKDLTPEKFFRDAVAIGIFSAYITNMSRNKFDSPHHIIAAWESAYEMTDIRAQLLQRTHIDIPYDYSKIIDALEELK